MTTTEGNQAHEEPAPQLAALLAERERHVHHLRQVHREFGGWSIGVGKLRIRAVVGTNFIAIVFVLWHLLLGATGVAGTLFWEEGRELAVALLVGALFSFGSFLAQFWSQAMTSSSCHTLPTNSRWRSTQSSTQGVARRCDSVTALASAFASSFVGVRPLRAATSFFSS